MLFVMMAHLFTQMLRIHFKKTIVLTMPMAKQLIAASLSQDRSIYLRVLNEIRYRLKRNQIAYLSHRKKVMKMIGSKT